MPQNFASGPLGGASSAGNLISQLTQQFAQQHQNQHGPVMTPGGGGTGGPLQGPLPTGQHPLNPGNFEGQFPTGPGQVGIGQPTPQPLPPTPAPGNSGGTVGMVPGVPGSVGLNPGMGGPMQGQQHQDGWKNGGMGGFGNMFGGPFGMGGMGGMGRFGGMGGMGSLSNLQLPADMTAADLISKLSSLNYRDLFHEYRGDMRDWRHGGRDGDRPTWMSELAQALGGTYGAAPTTTTPATGTPVQGIAVGEPNPAAPIAPVAPVPAPTPPNPDQAAQDFYNSHGYYPGA